MNRIETKGIGQIAVYVDDLPAAVAFYRDRLGLRYLFEAGGMAFLETDGIRLMLTQPNADDAVRRASILYFRVGDIDAAWSGLMAANTTAKEAPEQVYVAGGVALWLAFFEDPSGNVMALMEERPIGRALR